MTHEPNTLISPTGVQHPRIWLALAVATLVAITAAIVLAKGAPSGADASLQLPRNAIGEVSPLSVIDHSVVESKGLADEPDMTGASIGAYQP